MNHIDRFLRYLQLEKHYSNLTVLAYGNDLKQFMHFVGETYEIQHSARVDAFHIRSWIVHLIEQGMSARSIHRKLSALKSFYKYLLKNGVVTTNPMKGVQAPKVRKKLPAFVEENKLDRLINILSALNYGTFGDKTTYLVVTLLYATGMRRSELINLKHSDIDFSNKAVRVTGKGNKQRWIPVDEKLLNTIEDYIKAKEKRFGNALPSDHLLLTNNGNPLYPQYVYRVVKKYLTLVTTLQQKSPHILRHSFATHLANKGAELNAIKELLGHSSLAATQVYTHNTIEQLKSIYKKAHPKA